MKDEEYILLKEAAGLIKQKHFSEAARIYQKIAECFKQKNFYQKSIAAYEKALSLAPNIDMYVPLANLYEKLHQRFMAYGVLKSAFEELKQRQSYDQALETGFRMQQLEPDLSYPHEMIGRVYFEMGHPKESTYEFIKAFEKSKRLRLLYIAFKLSPRNKLIWSHLRQFLEEKHGKNVPSAQKLAQLAGTENSPPPTKQSGREWTEELAHIKALLDENLFDEAQLNLNTILQNAPNHPEALKLQANLHNNEAAWLGDKEAPDPDLIVKSLTKDLGLAETEPTPPSTISLATPTKELPSDTLYELAIAYKEMGLFKEAIELLESKVISKAPPSTLLWNSLLLITICKINLQDPQGAIKLIEKTFSSTPSFSKDYQLSFMYYLSLAYEGTENLKQALFYLRKIEKIDKKYRDIDEQIKKIRRKLHLSK